MSKLLSKCLVDHHTVLVATQQHFPANMEVPFYVQWGRHCRRKKASGTSLDNTTDWKGKQLLLQLWNYIPLYNNQLARPLLFCMVLLGALYWCQERATIHDCLSIKSYYLGLKFYVMSCVLVVAIITAMQSPKFSPNQNRKKRDQICCQILEMRQTVITEQVPRREQTTFFHF